jgi:hypothetical protein
MILYLATLNPNQNEMGDHSFFPLAFFLGGRGGNMKSKWDGRNKRGGVKCIINHQPLLWVALFFMHFSKGKGHKPQEHYYN